jgi:UPF0489 domain
MSYQTPYTLKENVGNNHFSWETRQKEQWRTPSITIPSLKSWTLDDIQIGEEIVFEEIYNGKIQSSVWLKNFIYCEAWTIEGYAIPLVVFDNHNHALYFWVDAIRNGILQKWFELIHIDEHSDLWENTYPFDGDKAIQEEKYAWEFTNFFCNVGNYIIPGLECGIIGSMIRIENEYQIDTSMNYEPSENSVLNLDLDFFAPEMSFIDEKKKIQCIRNLMRKVKYVTIATSPYFIEPWIALEKLRKILN